MDIIYLIKNLIEHLSFVLTGTTTPLLGKNTPISSQTSPTSYLKVKSKRIVAIKQSKI
jgi:hypothetical protein